MHWILEGQKLPLLSVALLPRGLSYNAAKQWLREGCLGKAMHAASLGAKGSQRGLSARAEGSLLFSCALEVSSHFLSLGSHQATLLGVGGDEEQIQVMTLSPLQQALLLSTQWPCRGGSREGGGKKVVESQNPWASQGEGGESSDLAWPDFLPSFLLILHT